MATPIAPRTLGSSDLVISGVGMGCNNFSRPASPTVEQNASTRVIHAAIDTGITFFDTAEMYGSEPGMSETYMGVALRHRRDQVQIATKWGLKGKAPAGMEDKGPRGGETYIRAAIEGSLRRLQTDYVDLYQLHEPDPEVPIEETLGVLADLVAEGKVRQIGHSNFTADQLREADDAASSRGDGLRFVSAQNEYSLLNREVEGELLGECVERNIGFLPYFPLYNGLLTGKYSASSGEGRITRQKPHLLDDVDWAQLDAYREICARVGEPMALVSIAWLLAQPGVASVIAGATSTAQVIQNASGAQEDLGEETIQEISELFA